MKFRSGQCSYRGYVITNHGYYHPDNHVWWEAVKDNNADYRGRTLREVMRMIDDGFRDEETKELKDRIALFEAALKPIMECNYVWESKEEDIYAYISRVQVVIEKAQRIILEAWDDKNYFDEDAHNRVAKAVRESEGKK